MSRKVFYRCASASLLACFAASAAHATNYVRNYLVDQILLPTSSPLAASYAIDVDGDGFPDNNMGQVLSAFATEGLDFQGLMDAEVASGSIVHLVGLRSTDALFKNDPAAQATWCIGVPTAAPPKFDGTDIPSCADTSGIFVAALSGGSFTSPAPPSAPNPVSLDLDLALGASIVRLTVLNARLSFTINDGGDISVGQINGSIPHDELLTTFAPALSTACNDSIQNNPSSNFSTTCLNIFDTGCTDAPAFFGDGQIELCEVVENSLFKALIKPDVQVVDGGILVDANSIGFRFTAIAYDRLFASGFEL